MRGRKPKTAVEKKASGNPGKRKLPTPEDVAVPGDMVCPFPLVTHGDALMLSFEDALNERSRVYWEVYLENTTPGHLAPVDAPLLANLCRNLALADLCLTEVSRDGLTIKGARGAARHPSLMSYKGAMDTAAKIATQLGLTVAERNRVGGSGKSGDVNPFDGFD